MRVMAWVTELRDFAARSRQRWRARRFGAFHEEAQAQAVQTRQALL